MPEPDRYALEQALTLRDDWQFSRIFAPASARAGFTALLALRAELQHVIGQASEPGIAAMKLEWWRGEIERGFEGVAQHPLAQAIASHLAGISAPEYCVEMIDAAETESETGATLTEQDFRLYLYRSGGVLAEQLVLLSGISDRHALDTARRLGQLRRYMDMLLSANSMLRAGRWLFPSTWLQENELTLKAALEAGADPRVKSLRETLLAALDQERIQARTAMEDARLPPALLLQWPLMQRDYAQLRNEPDAMLEAPPRKSNALSRLWTAWRGARAAAKQ